LDLLDYAKTADVSCELGDPNRPAHEVVELMKPKAEELGIIIERDFSQDLEAFHFDPELIHRCLLNLVTNAIDACAEEKGSDKGNKVIVRTSSADEWGVEYQVIDNGGGMEEETKENLFKSFFTTKGEHQARTNGAWNTRSLITAVVWKKRPKKIYLKVFSQQKGAVVPG
jgi:signal transduction histidine kinase